MDIFGGLSSLDLGKIVSVQFLQFENTKIKRAENAFSYVIETSGISEVSGSEISLIIPDHVGMILRL